MDKNAELALPIQEPSKDVISHAMEMAHGYTIGRTESITFQSSRTVSVWELTHADKPGEVLVLLREGKQFIGCRKSKGNFMCVVKNYRAKAREKARNVKGRVLH